MYTSIWQVTKLSFWMSKPDNHKLKLPLTFYKCNFFIFTYKTENSSVDQCGYKYFGVKIIHIKLSTGNTNWITHSLYAINIFNVHNRSPTKAYISIVLKCGNSLLNINTKFLQQICFYQMTLRMSKLYFSSNGCVRKY